MKLCVVEDLPDNAIYPFRNGDRMLFMGEIEQMPGHCVVATSSGKVIWGYHSEHFRILTDDEA